MKQGKMGMGPLIIIILGIIVIFLVVGSIFPQVRKPVDKIFEAVGLAQPKQEQQGLAERDIGDVPLLQTELAGDKDQIKLQISRAISSCYGKMVRNSKEDTDRAQNTKCGTISFTVATPFTKTEIVNEVKKDNEKASRVLSADWGEGDTTDRGDTMPSGSYLICADFDDNLWPIPNDTDMYVTNNLGYECE